VAERRNAVYPQTVRGMAPGVGFIKHVILGDNDAYMSRQVIPPVKESVKSPPAANRSADGGLGRFSCAYCGLRRRFRLLPGLSGLALDIAETAGTIE
jgi:hypothetical protein